MTWNKCVILNIDMPSRDTSHKQQPRERETETETETEREMIDPCYSLHDLYDV